MPGVQLSTLKYVQKQALVHLNGLFIVNADVFDVHTHVMSIVKTILHINGLNHLFAYTGT